MNDKLVSDVYRVVKFLERFIEPGMTEQLAYEISFKILYDDNDKIGGTE